MRGLKIERLLAAAAGLIVANIYYVQPLTSLISAELGIPIERAGLLVSFTQLGYGAGLLLLVPLADLVENRRLVVTLAVLETICLLLAGNAHSVIVFMAASLLIGANAVAVQILVPYVTYLTPEATRGRAVGTVVSGLGIGIMMARPVSSFVADAGSWRGMFLLSGALMAVLALVMRLALPPRKSAPLLGYVTLLKSLGPIAAGSETLRRRASYQACLFGSFSIFWTAVPLWLMSTRFGYTQRGVAWVAVAGVAGAIGPSIAGRVADRGFTSAGTLVAMILAIASFAVSMLAMPLRVGVWPVIVCAVLLDFAVSSNLLFGQRAIFALNPEQRSRMNAVYMTTFFIAGATCSALSTWCFAHYGWPGVALAGGVLPLIALTYFLTE